MAKGHLWAVCVYCGCIAEDTYWPDGDKCPNSDCVATDMARKWFASRNEAFNYGLEVLEARREALRTSRTLKRVVLLCIAPGCAVAYWGPGPCPSCGGPGEPAPTPPPQPERGAGFLCADCAHRGACPPGADLRRITRGGTPDDECCWEYQQNDVCSTCGHSA